MVLQGILQLIQNLLFGNFSSSSQEQRALIGGLPCIISSQSKSGTKGKPHESSPPLNSIRRQVRDGLVKGPVENSALGCMEQQYCSQCCLNTSCEAWKRKPESTWQLLLNVASYCSVGNQHKIAKHILVWYLTLKNLQKIIFVGRKKQCVHFPSIYIKANLPQNE